MGTQFEFSCQRCGYTAQVSGGIDFGFVVETQTVFCFTCDKLRDIVTRYRGVGQMSHRDEAELDQSRLNRCPHCHGIELAVWENGDRCPKCDGDVVRTRFVMDWD